MVFSPAVTLGAIFAFSFKGTTIDNGPDQNFSAIFVAKPVKLYFLVCSMKETCTISGLIAGRSLN